MTKHNLTENDVKYVIENGALSDIAGNNRRRFYKATLPDGRNAKVRMLNGVIADAFILH